MAKYQCLVSKPKSTFRVLLNLRACQGKHPKIHGPSQPGALWKAWENQWIRRLEVGMETIQYVVLIRRPQWNLRGSQRMQQRWRAATMVWQDVTSLREPKGQKWPWTTHSHYHQYPGPWSNSAKPRHPRERKGEEKWKEACINWAINQMKAWF